MRNPTVEFITRMKLRELHRQRETFQQTYRELQAEADAAESPGERLKVLYEGLREIEFARQKLHPDIMNLEVLLHEIESGAAADELVQLWLERLEEEFQCGRLRSEFVYLFGALLEEWASAKRQAGSELRHEIAEEHSRALQEVLTASPANRHAEMLEPLFAGLGSARQRIRGRVEKLSEEDRLGSPVHSSELEYVLQAIQQDIYRPAGLRQEAGSFLENKSLQRELLDALTIMFEDWESWTWNEALATRAQWTRNKWRLYTDDDLPVACLLELLARRWQGVFRGAMAATYPLRLTRLKKLLDLNAPEVIMMNERRMLAETADLGHAQETLIWDELAWNQPWSELSQEEQMDLLTEGTSIRSQRINSLFEPMRNFPLSTSYDGGGSEEYEGGFGLMVALVNAELQLARAAFTERPVAILKTDLRNFYPTLPHDLLLTILREIGLTESQLQFFARFLSLPLQGPDGQPTAARRGVMVGYGLSRLLAELFLWCLERHITQDNRVMIVRMVDDICLMSPEPEAVVTAWQRLQDFCRQCGVEVNQEKSGAVCIGGELSAALPQAVPRWAMLQLDAEGNWSVHQPTFEDHLGQTRAAMLKSSSILTWIEQYNANLKFLVSALALNMPLGESHRSSTNAALARFHRQTFDEQTGMVEQIRRTIQERFQGDAAADSIPEAWIYWPITAGGLGVRNPLITAAQFVRAEPEEDDQEELDAPPPPGWERIDNEWSNRYQALLQPVVPRQPRESKVMKTLVDDFIQRGTTISAGAQKGLDAYWRWVLCIWGPQILKRLGTFRFLITELVPVQLITQRQLQETSLEESLDGDEDFEDDGDN